jgi:hypothetical protein
VDAVTSVFASTQSLSGTSTGALSVTVLVAVLGSSVLATIVTTVMTGLRATSSVRRDSYAAAVEAVVAWCEYPYRIRRRTDDEPATLAGLANLGHDLQERLARHRAWVSAENSAVGQVFDQVITAVRVPVGRASAEAWNTSPVTTAQGMNVTPFGPGDLSQDLNRLNVAVAYRFGVRRFMPPFLVRIRLAARSSLQDS